MARMTKALCIDSTCSAVSFTSTDKLHERVCAPFMLPAAWHRTDQYANNHIEADHGHLKSRLRPMRGLKQGRSAKVVIAGHAFVQNLRRGHYELAVEEPVTRRVAVAFDELALAI